jgi:hypothetical protein
MYTPQKGEQSAEMLTQADRRLLVDEIGELHARHPKLMDMIPAVTRGYLKPPDSPEHCIFAQTSRCVSADLETRITPCQYGGNPDCTQCGCMASVGFEALGQYRLGGVLPLKTIFAGSLRAGTVVRRLRGQQVP